MAALAQPMFNSLPVVLAATWFSMSERDVATAIASLFNPLGNALGQVAKEYHAPAFNLQTILFVTFCLNV